MSEPLRHAFSLDVEEWFQVANLAHEFPRESWDAAPSRLGPAMDRVLEVLDRRGVRATLFFLGWIAERHPELVERCVAAGHEIASHGYDHKFLWDLDPESLHLDLERTEQALQAAGAPRPVGFRASTFTLTRRTWWAFDVLAERGYAYDSSVHPVRHPTYGVPGFDPGISDVSAEGGAGNVLEFPVATYPLFGRNWPVGGGGYFRLLPGWLHRRFYAGLEKRGRPTATYLHPWEFDPDQPRIEAPAFAKFRHYLNLDRTLARLDQLLGRFQFGTLRAVLEDAGHGDRLRVADAMVPAARVPSSDA